MLKDKYKKWKRGEVTKSSFIERVLFLWIEFFGDLFLGLITIILFVTVPLWGGFYFVYKLLIAKDKHKEKIFEDEKSTFDQRS